MKKLWYVPILALALLTTATGFAQTTFESTLGRSADVEYPWFTWDGQQLETGQYLLVSGTKAYTGLRSGILLNRLKSTGTTESVSGLIYSESGNMNLEPHSIDFNPQAVSGEIHLYIGGSIQPAGSNNRALLVRTLASGTLRDGGGYYQTPMSSSHSENIMAVERLANFDIAVAGTTGMPESGGGIRQIFFAARFSKAPSTRKWAYRYTLPASSTKNYVVKETCIGKVLLSGGTTETEVLAITGSMYDKATPGNKHTFFCCINLTDGSVLWTNIVNSGLGLDEGMDIAQNPYSRDFLIVGYAAGAGALTTTKRMWVCKFDQTGAFQGGGLHTLTTANDLDFVA
ncbi:MAG: hypothetical protein JNK89_06180, partial [Saprospiraceae bacterium]|nr:hypothetical protein [Saprospiraceae bacterium]